MKGIGVRNLGVQVVVCMGYVAWRSLVGVVVDVEIHSRLPVLLPPACRCLFFRRFR